MLFKGTYSSNFYRKLQRYVHKEYRKSQAFKNIKKVFYNPFKASKQQLRSIILLGYYLPSAFLDKIKLKTMKPNNG